MKFKDLSGVKLEDDGVEPIENTDIDISSMKAQEKKRYTQDTKYRKHLTIWVMCIVPIWIIGVFVVVCLCASECWHLSDIAFSALLTTTTANILGLAYIVLKGMFPSNKDKE